ncbi:hypothetical protein HNP55_000338 [Paucibacter oligotrophus]|uniref:Uncharacterized protein n=1 Tax=Roseateles oligotrophus TaxID=1769250 RepID=A0A840L4U2_9BURK|nr:hypothetical protein [Roseateles oligotrophus]MBB4841843.1 hypothetical protein [Roseateles oligotrophus]
MNAKVHEKFFTWFKLVEAGGITSYSSPDRPPKNVFTVQDLENGWCERDPDYTDLPGPPTIAQKAPVSHAIHPSPVFHTLDEALLWIKDDESKPWRADALQYTLFVHRAIGPAY